MLKIKNMTIAYQGIEVVRDFSLTVGKSQIVSIVGESGSGKTSVIRSILGLLSKGGRITGGEMIFKGKNLVECKEAEYQELRGREISMIFQDSGAMLNPTRTIGSMFVEYYKTHERITKKDAWEKGREMLERMRLSNTENIMKSYPFQLSGGMRQRVGIALGMSYQPELLLADEPTSALDVTTQAQIVKEMLNLRKNFGTSLIMVTHNLGVAAYMSDYIIVMKDGMIVDEGDVDYILHSSTEEYTRLLLESVPSMQGGKMNE